MPEPAYDRSRFDAIFAGMSEGMLIADPRGNILDMNPAGLKFHRWDSKAKALRNIADFPEFRLRCADGSLLPAEDWPLARVLRGETFSDFEVWLARPDIGETWMGSYSGTPIRSGTGEIMLAVLTFRDITEEYRTKDKLRISEQRLRMAVEAGGIGIWNWDLVHHEFLMSDQCRTLFGLPPGAPMSFGSFLGVLHPADRERAEQVMSRALAQGTFFDLEYRTIWPDGTTHWILARGRVDTDALGMALRMQGTTLNIDAQKRAEIALRESEERFRRLTETSTFGVAMGTRGGAIIYANAALLRMLGYTAGEVREGRLRWDVLTPPEFAAITSRGMEQLNATGAWEPYEKVYIAKDGRRIPILIGASVLERDASGEPVIAAFILDLTVRKHLEEQLRRVQRYESIGVLAAGVAHDFNNLLTEIMGGASLLQHSLPRDDRSQELLAQIVSASDRAAGLTRQLLAYAGKARFVSRLLDLSSTVRDAVAEASIPKAVPIKLELDDAIPLIQGDGSQIRQVVLNLILNGAEAIADKAGVVRVATGLQDVDQVRYAFLEVSDTGCGMDQEAVAKIFDPFFTTKFLGRGLGLAAVQGIVRAHSGMIRVSSEPGKGSCFRVLFPACTEG